MALHALKGEHLGNQIDFVQDGAEALDYLVCRGKHVARSPDHRPKLIVLDLKLPKVDGLQVLREIKGNPHTRAIPVVILTSSRGEKDVVEGYRSGVNSYIQKPVDFDQLRQAVRTLGLYWLVVNQTPPQQAFAA